MKLTKRQKSIVEHAAFSGAATATAGGISYLSAHGADLVGQRYEVVLAAVLIPVLQAGLKWFRTRDKAVSEGDTPPSSK